MLAMRLMGALTWGDDTGVVASELERERIALSTCSRSASEGGEARRWTADAEGVAAVADALPLPLPLLEALRLNAMVGVYARGVSASGGDEK